LFERPPEEEATFSGQVGGSRAATSLSGDVASGRAAARALHGFLGQEPALCGRRAPAAIPRRFQEKSAAEKLPARPSKNPATTMSDRFGRDLWSGTVAASRKLHRGVFARLSDPCLLELRGEQLEDLLLEPSRRARAA